MDNLIKGAVNKIKQFANTTLNTKFMPGQQMTVNQAFGKATQNFAQDFGNVLRGTGGIQGQQLKAPIIPKIPVVSNFAQMAGNTGQTVATGMTGIYRGGNNMIQGIQQQNPIKFGQGLVNTGFGAAQIASAGTPFFTGANLLSQSGGTLTQKIGKGLMQGQTGITGLAPNVKENQINVLGIKFDPIVGAASLVGFTKNPAWMKIFGKTTKLAEYGLKGIAFKGGVEGLIQGLDQLPDNPTNKDITNTLLTNIAMGTGAEVGTKVVGDIFKKINGSQLVGELKNKMLSPYARETVVTAKGTMPRWKAIIRQSLGENIYGTRQDATELVNAESSFEIPSQKIKVTKDGKIKVTPQTPELTQPKIDAGEKLRGYVESIKTNKKTPGQLTGQFEGMTNTTYVPKSNDKLSLFAKTLVNKDVAAAERYVTEHFDDQAVATSHQLIDYYSKLKNFDKAAEIAVSTAEKLTEAGRTVQAASLYNKLGPSGIQRYAATQLSKFKQQLKPEDAKRLYDMSLLIQKMPDGDAKMLEQQKLLDEVGKLIPTPFLRKTITLWKANLLTGLKTSVRNITSNTVNLAAETAKDAPATITDMLSSIFTGKRTKTFTTQGIGEGSVQGVKEGLKLLTTGVDSRKTLGKMDVTPINWGNNPIQKAAKAYTDTVFRFLGAQDKPFYYARLKQSLYDQAGAEAINAGQRGNQQFIKNLVDNPTEQMIKTSIHDAEMAVFQQKTKLGSIINAAKRSVEAEAKKGNFGSSVLSAIGEFTVPFTGVPSGVASQLINYSPVGIVKTIIENIGKGKFDQRTFSEGLGRGITGTGIMAIGAELAKNNLITLEYPTDAKEQQQWDLEGKKPYSILWDGKWRSIGSLGPQAQALLTGAAYAKKGLSGAAIGALKSQAEQTFLKGVSSLTEAIVDPTKKGMAYVGNIVGGFVPSIVSDVSRSMDPYQREINKTNDLKYLEDIIKNRLPVIRQELLPKRNAFGEIMKTEPAGALQMIDIFNSSQAKTSPVVQELRRLLDIEEGATPTKIPVTQSIGGQKIKLSYELQDLLESKSGPVIKRIMEETIATPQYQALTDDKRQQLLQKIINDVRGVEKLKVVSGAKLAPEATAKAALDLSKNQQNYLMTGNLPLNYPSAPRTGQLPTTQTEAMNRILTGQTTAPGQIQTTLGGVKFAQPTTELGKMELSKQIGAITTQINDIYDMYKMGAISEQEANTQISQLKAQQTAMRKLISKTGKAKVAKIALRRISKGKNAKFKTIASKVKKLKTIKGPSFKMAKTKQPKIKVKMPKIGRIA